MHHTVTDDSIADMIDAFYSKARNDELLGPIFASAIGVEWELHLTKMEAFWSSVLLESRTYKGNPMVAHLELPRLTHHHFDRWLQLWGETAGALCSDELASLFVQKARTIGARLLHTISRYHDPALREADEAARPTV